MLTEELMQGAQKYLMDTYARYPLALARGKGTRVYDVEGREYLDFLAGVAVNVLGHCHQKVTQALQQQALRLVHTSNLFYTEPQVKLARTLRSPTRSSSATAGRRRTKRRSSWRGVGRMQKTARAASKSSQC